MSYRIDYAKNMQKRDLRKHFKLGIRACLFVAVIVCILLISGVFTNNERISVVPGNPQITEQAVSNLINSVKGGESISSAVTTFCKFILENA